MSIVKSPAAAHYLGLELSTLHRWRRAGVGPRFVKMGGAIRYNTADLDDFIAESTRRPSGDSSTTGGEVSE
jgi:predicted DNA-binding transcriptional regulator AlpA